MEEQPIDGKKYGELLAGSLPCVIETTEEHERLLTAAEALMDKGDQLSREERKLLELLVLLIEIFERKVEDAEQEDEDEQEEDEQAPVPDVDPPPPLPHETLQRLLKGRGWEPDALNDIFGNPKASNEVVAGRKRISKGQAKALGKLFDVPPRLFSKE